MKKLQGGRNALLRGGHASCVLLAASLPATSARRQVSRSTYCVRQDAGRGTQDACPPRGKRGVAAFCKNSFRAFFFSVAFFFSGCVSKIEPTATLLPGRTIQLPPPGITPPVHREQLLSATTAGGTHALHVVLDANETGVTLVGFSVTGIRLFKAVYDGAGIATEQLAVVGDLPPANQVLADIMFAYWPPASWKARLPAGWTLADETGATRVLRDAAGDAVLEIFYENISGAREPVCVRHKIFGYEIRIKNLDETGED